VSQETCLFNIQATSYKNNPWKRVWVNPPCRKKIYTSITAISAYVVLLVLSILIQIIGIVYVYPRLYDLIMEVR